MTDPRHKQWALQWKAAAAALQRVRDNELQALDHAERIRQSDDPYRNGLVEFQRWMMHKAILDAYANDRNS